ncbi:zinc finger protein 541-like isoform X2 [Manacus candei]|uniref:zinc finger protein 541-like isoform X2 n=1 Tax=Manacus candei TaxID=415023 RepID=UPI0022269814|nr:zinc finger protein 541-like isoform X2 [Manacus candei]
MWYCLFDGVRILCMLSWRHFTEKHREHREPSLHCFPLFRGLPRHALMGRSSKQTCHRRSKSSNDSTTVIYPRWVPWGSVWNAGLVPQQPLLSPAPAAVGGTQVDRWWSVSCRIWSWAFSKQPAPSLSPGSGFWVNILISSCAPRIASGLPKVERRGKMKRKARVRIKPHISVGNDFQAELPELQARPPTEDEEHASLVWKPWEDTDSVMETHDRGSDTWTPHEKESFQMAFHTYGKDFHLIQKEIQSKTVAQCVEYYYFWKKERRIAPPPAQTVGRPKKSKSPPKEENGEMEKRSRRRPRSTVCPCCKSPQPPRSAGGLFPCRTCKRVFETMKERNRHERRHCPQKEDEPHPKKKRLNYGVSGASKS